MKIISKARFQQHFHYNVKLALNGICQIENLANFAKRGHSNNTCTLEGGGGVRQSVTHTFLIF